MKTYLCVNETIRESDAKTIKAAIELAREEHCGRIIIPALNERTGKEEWIIDETIELPSHTEIILDGAHLTLASGKYLNMFSAIGKAKEGNTTVDDTVKGIYIHGKNGAVLDGGEYNGLHERNAKELGIDIYKNTTLLFFNVDGLVVENLSIINQRWWGVTNIFVRNAVYKNIRFLADFSRKTGDCVHIPGEYPKTYDEIYVKNADGIDLRIGCSDFIIENITGFTEDDSVALTALGGEVYKGLFVEGLSPNIRRVEMKNICTDSYCANIRLLAANGYKIEHVTIDGVCSLLSDRRTPDQEGRNNAAVRIGDMRYSSDYSNPDDVHHITVRNVSSESACAVTVCNGISASLFENITAHGGYAAIGTFRKKNEETGDIEYYRATLKKCRISNINTVLKDTVPVLEEYIDFIN